MLKSLLRSRATAGLAAMAVGLGAPASVSAGGREYAAADSEPLVVIRSVTVVDVRSGALLRDRDVVISGHRITRVASTGKVPPSPGAKVIDGRGKFLVPGFNDMHLHSLNLQGVERQNELDLLLANGVTGFRQMSGTPALLQERRDGQLAPSPDTPAVLAMPGQIFTSFNAPNPAAAIQEVDRQKAQGADFLKIIDVDRATFLAIQQEARKVGLPTAGHLPDRVDPVTASAAGFGAIEHLGPFATILISCSSDEAGIRAMIASRPPRNYGGLVPGAGPPPAPEVLARIIAAAAAAPLIGAMQRDPKFTSFLTHLVATFDEAKCRTMVAQLAKNGMWQSPTLIRDRTLDFPDATASRADPNLRYVPTSTRRLWADLADRFSAQATPADRASLEEFWKLQLRLLRLFNESSTMMVAGSDTGGQWDIAGFSLHQDFDLLAAGGISPLKVLQMTTLNAAKFLGREDVMGSVAAGKDADLVLLDGNPISSVSNLHRIAGVVRFGKFYSRADLDALLEKVASRAGGTHP
ncbi:MAG: hypothetical protein JWR80_4402 [Bradyrhizobium sp.]|nr:hypothetical protein [Bradyrhizobium sp.]